jgi:hypothetical protein
MSFEELLQLCPQADMMVYLWPIAVSPCYMVLTWPDISRISPGKCRINLANAVSTLQMPYQPRKRRITPYKYTPPNYIPGGNSTHHK